MKGASTRNRYEVIQTYTEWPSRSTDEPRVILTTKSPDFRSTCLDDFSPTLFPAIVASSEPRLTTCLAKRIYALISLMS
ncbi:unnamed protein product [Timema podura]|uniref:Uncharacterized protein n=1 Tax=Timema podura TaxID=61482 RepID=A0ABN7NJ66_TIMPD|nr:unnamed protein product [Timema podura]